MGRLLCLGLSLALAGCGGGEAVTNNSVTPTPTPKPTPMLGGVNLDKPITASGAAGWTLDIAPGTIAYAAATRSPPTDFYPVSPSLTDDRAVFATKTPEAEPVTITLTNKACTAGKETLPLTAEVRIGARTQRGCAGPAQPRPGPTPAVREDNATEAH
jgi:uncharacterized membrane protein